MSSLQAFDTNYLVALTHPRSEARQSAFAALEQSVESVIPCIVYGEFWYGLARGNPGKTAPKRKLFEKYIKHMRVLWLDQETLQRFHELSWELERNGATIPGNDIWIAALCLQHDAILITDDFDFKQVPGLKIRSW
ncbi:PIN domain-containing protein [bacterium]|nr:PIN domain-containing protein [bacterium]